MSFCNVYPCIGAKKSPFCKTNTQKRVAKVNNLRTEEKPSFVYCVSVYWGKEITALITPHSCTDVCGFWQRCSLFISLPQIDNLCHTFHHCQRHITQIVLLGLNDCRAHHTAFFDLFSHLTKIETKGHNPPPKNIK